MPQYHLLGETQAELALKESNRRAVSSSGKTGNNNFNFFNPFSWNLGNTTLGKPIIMDNSSPLPKAEKIGRGFGEIVSSGFFLNPAGNFGFNYGVKTAKDTAKLANNVIGGVGSFIKGTAGNLIFFGLIALFVYSYIRKRA